MPIVALAVFDEASDACIIAGVSEDGSYVQKFPVDMMMLTRKAPALAECTRGLVERCETARLNGVPAPLVESALRFFTHQELSFELEHGVELMDFCLQFAFDDLLQLVVKSIVERLDAPTALSYLPVLYRLPEEMSRRACMLVDTKAQLALMSDAFLQLDAASVISLLQRFTLDIDEAALFRHVERWISSSAELKTAPDDERQKTVQTILRQFRYGLMTREDFDAGPALLMNTEDLASVNRWLSGGEKPDWCLDKCRVGRGRALARDTTEWKPYTFGTAKALTLRLSPISVPMWIAGIETCIWGSFEKAEIARDRWYTMVACLNNCSADLCTNKSLKTLASIELPYYNEPLRIKFQSLPSSDKYRDAGLIKRIVVHPPVPRRFKQFPPKQTTSGNSLRCISETFKRIFK